MMKKRIPKLKRVFVVLGIVMFYTLVVLVLSEMGGGKVLYESEQPSTIDYHSFDPYVLRIVEGSVQWATFMWPRSYVIKITKKADSSYGHFIETDIFMGWNGEVSSTWTEDGVELAFPLGHRLMIPKRAFIGGR